MYSDNNNSKVLVEWHDRALENLAVRHAAVRVVTSNIATAVVTWRDMGIHPVMVAIFTSVHDIGEDFISSLDCFP